MNTAVLEAKEYIASLEAKVQTLEETLKQGDSYIANTFRLPEQLADLFGLLITLPVVPTEVIQKQIGIAQTKMAIYRLRAHLKEFGIEVQSKPRVGYWLEGRTKEKIDNILGEKYGNALRSKPKV